jgi:chromosome segregation ATPase
MENSRLKELNLKKRKLEKEIEDEQKREKFINNELATFNKEKNSIDKSISDLKKEIETLETKRKKLLEDFKKICIHEDKYDHKNEWMDSVHKCKYCEREVTYGVYGDGG